MSTRIVKAHIMNYELVTAVRPQDAHILLLYRESGDLANIVMAMFHNETTMERVMSLYNQGIFIGYMSAINGNAIESWPADYSVVNQHGHYHTKIHGASIDSIDSIDWAFGVDGDLYLNVYKLGYADGLDQWVIQHEEMDYIFEED